MSLASTLWYPQTFSHVNVLSEWENKQSQRGQTRASKYANELLAPLLHECWWYTPVALHALHFLVNVHWIHSQVRTELNYISVCRLFIWHHHFYLLCQVGMNKRKCTFLMQCICVQNLQNGVKIFDSNVTGVFSWQNNVIWIIWMYKEKKIFFKEAVFWAVQVAWGLHAILDCCFAIKT